MRGFKIYLLIIIGAILAGCEKDETPGGINAREVRLFANMGVHISSLEQTKTIVNGVVGNSTDEALSIGIVRMDESVHKECWPYFRSETEGSLVPLTAELGIPDNDEGSIRIVSNFKDGSNNDAPQFFMNSQDSVSYAAWYPSSGTFNSTNEKTTVTFNIPAEGNMDIMYAEPVAGMMGTGFDVMKFNHALSLFRIHVYKNTSLEWGNVKSITISGMPNVCTLTLPHSLKNNTCSVEYSGTANTMQHECDVPVVQGIENKTLVKEWIAAPAPGTNGLKMLSFAIETAEGEGVAENTAGEHTLAIAQNFLPGYAYDIVLRFSDAGTVNAEVQIADWGKGDKISSDINTSGTFYDLSSTGTANCYIVSSANFAYCFDATVKGNGNTVALGGGIETTLNPKTVEIVWIDDAVKDDFVLETATEVDGVTRGRIVEGKVLFRVIGAKDSETGTVDKSNKSLHSEGNVLLGVRDEAGNMLWTWHIWITDKPQKQNYTRGYIALDRNLGAIAAKPEGNPLSSRGMFGLFYQWGRPTPFQLYQDENGNWKVRAKDSQTRVIPDVAVANPGIFYGSRDQYDGHDWVDRTVFQNINNLWGYREVEHSQPIKTIYDPCPVGYHVPYHRSWELLEEFWSEKTEFEAAPNKADFWKGLAGIEFVIEGNSIWYPLQGYININGVYMHGHVHKNSDGNYKHEPIPIVENWSSLVNRHDADDASLEPGVDERINDSPYRLQFTRDYLAKLSEDGEYTNRTRGLAVRCVSDNTADVVKDLSASQTANCYMVHENGFYKFKATVRGNGVGSLLPLGGTTTAEINGGLSTTISPAKVDVLWWQGDFMNGETDFPDSDDSEDSELQDAPANMCIKLLDDGIVTDDGYVAFQIKDFKKGNTILAAYDNAGNILWTWHIWLTDKPKDKISGNYTKMDRFLGATYAPTIPNTTGQQIVWPGPEGGQQAKQATFGFYYQWGKKDPIIGPPPISPGSSGTSYENGATVASSGWWIKDRVTGKWQYRKTIYVKPAASIPDVVKDPTAFYKSTTTEGAKSSQWFPESFADGYTNVALWGYAVADYSAVGQTFSKTMHDPCPPGYRTPFHYSWRYNSSEKYAEGDDNGEAITNLTNAERGFSSGGFVTNKTHFEKMWFPYAGYRNPLTGAHTNVGTNGYMNTGMPMGQYNTRSFWYGNYNSTQWGTGQYAGRHGSAYGKMVRCIKE